MDNYEWLDNYRPEGKFGLFSIDLKRVMTTEVMIMEVMIMEVMENIMSN